jgi:hypothetical protein
MTELVKVADIDKTHKNPIAELVQHVSMIVILRLRAKEKISMPRVLWGLWHLD